MLHESINQSVSPHHTPYSAMLSCSMLTAKRMPSFGDPVVRSNFRRLEPDLVSRRWILIFQARGAAITHTSRDGSSPDEAAD